MKVKITKEKWLEIGDSTGWTEDIGFGAGRFKFFTGPGVYCVCPYCGHKKKNVRMMPCEKLLCPRCGKMNMEKRYIEKNDQLSPGMNT